jgi:hypothetical protein
MRKIIDGRNPRKWMVALVRKDNPKGIIFAIPRTADQGEKEGVLREQILDRLCYYYEEVFFDATTEANRQKLTVEEVQGYLRALCNHLPREKAWIAKVSEEAGKEWLSLIGKKINGEDVRALLDTIRKGGMPFRVQSLR